MQKIGSLIRKESEGQIRKGLKEADSFFVVGYSGLSGADMNFLRLALRNSKGDFLVIKNSISKRVLKEAGLEEVSEMLHGPCGLIFIKDDIISTSKVLNNFAKEHETFKIEGGILKNRILNKADIATLAKIPPKEILYTQIAMGLKSPIVGLASVLNNTLKKLVIVLDQVKNKKNTT